MSQSVNDFKVSFDPSKKVNIKDRMNDYGKKHCKCDFSVPSSISEDPYHVENCPKSKKMNLIYIHPDNLEVYENAQRLRSDMISDKIVQDMIENWDWNKITPLEAVEYKDNHGVVHYVCTEGFGRLIACKMHPGITEIPVIIRKSEDYQDVVDSYYANHDKKMKKQITKGDDFSLAIRQGHPDALQIVNAIQNAGMTINEDKLGKNDNRYMIFTSSDICELAFQIHWDGKKLSVTEETMKKIIGIIEMYALLRKDFNKGNPIRDWNSVLMNMSNMIEIWKNYQQEANKKDEFITKLNISNIIDASKPRFIGTMKNIFENKYYKNKQNKKTHKAFAWLNLIKDKKYLSSPWLTKVSNDSTYFDLFMKFFQTKIK